MSIPLGADSVTILRGASRDNFGDRTGTDSGISVPGCLVQPTSSSEDTDRGDLVVSVMTAFLPAGTDIRVTDRVEWLGEVYQVDGDPARWRNETGAESHVQAELRITRGSA